MQMAFIRIKKIKGLDYYYLVESQWDPHKKISSQHIIKYLGNAKNVRIDDIPVEHRKNPKILTLLTSNSVIQQEKRLYLRELKDQVFESLKIGDTNKILNIADNFTKQSSLSEFYDLVLRPVMHQVGNLWARNELDISTEHVCSNIANEVVHLLNGSRKRTQKGFKVLICTPEGEIHALPCKVLESVLLAEGIDVVNLSPSVPTTSVLECMRETNPCILLISVSFSENLSSALRLIKNIEYHSNIPMILGGFAIDNLKRQEISSIISDSLSLHIIKESTLEDVVKTIKSLIINSMSKNKIIH